MIFVYSKNMHYNLDWEGFMSRKNIHSHGSGGKWYAMPDRFELCAMRDENGD